MMIASIPILPIKKMTICRYNVRGPKDPTKTYGRGRVERDSL